MTLSQELQTLEQIARLALSDLRAIETQHDLSREFKAVLQSTLADYVKACSDQKMRALAYDR